MSGTVMKDGLEFFGIKLPAEIAIVDLSLQNLSGFREGSAF
jgi:hypothetical protein